MGDSVLDKDESAILYYKGHEGSIKTDIQTMKLKLSQHEALTKQLISQYDELKSIIDDLVREVGKLKGNTPRRALTIRRQTSLFQMFSAETIASEEDENQTLSQDTYSFLVCSNMQSHSFWFGFIVFFIQMSTCTLLFLNLVQPGGIPPNIDTVVRVTQFIAIVIALLTQDDVQASIEQIGEGYNEHEIGKNFQHSSEYKWWFASLCRLIEGLFVLAASFLLIVQSANVRDLLMNFTAVSFISALDDVAFNLASVGFFGPNNLKKAQQIQETEYKIDPDTKKWGAQINQALLLSVMIVMLTGWGGVMFLQMSGQRLCQQLYVEFGDDSLAAISFASGLYDIQKENLNDRVSYIERRSGQRRGKIAFCEAENSWTFSFDSSNPCNWIAKSSSSDASVGTYDVRQTLSSPWVFKFGSASLNETVIVENMEHFRLSCFQNEMACSDETYGLLCNFKDPCLTFETKPALQESTVEYSLLSIFRFGRKIQAYDHPVYISYLDGKHSLILFTGAHWIKTRSSDVNITSYITYQDFHASSLPPNSIELISEGVHGLSSATPLSLQWFYPQYSLNQSGIPRLDLNRRASLDLSCTFCNERTNPCLFGGKCQNDGTCICNHGASGALCREVPTGNGICNPFFNIAEFNYDGGDCCGASCKTSTSCGLSGLSFAFNETLTTAGYGYPSCVDPKMVPITLLYEQWRGATFTEAHLTCQGTTYLHIPPFIFPMDLYGTQVVYVKDGTECDFTLTLQNDFFKRLTHAEFRIKVHSGQGIDDPRTLLGETRGTFGQMAVTGSVSFVVKKSCLQSEIPNGSNMLPYKIESSGEHLWWNDASPQVKAFRWLNSDDSEWSLCSRSNGLQQRYALATINFATNNKLAHEGTWLDETHECNWLGVSCDPKKSVAMRSVTGIELKSYGLNGTLPMEIGLLQNLEMFNADDNYLIGTIPKAFGNLTNLGKLSLGFNSFSGSIPSQLGHCKKLYNLNLESNSLHGTLPYEICNLVSFKLLNIAVNQLSGTICSGIYSMRNLVTLKMHVNRFTGPILSEIGELTNLKSINFQRNRLTGTMSTELGQLTNLEELYLGLNRLSGTICSELGNLSILNKLLLGRNRHSGTIPFDLFRLKKLNVFLVFNNRLSGNISGFGLLENLHELSLDNNIFNGTIGNEFSNLRGLSESDNRVALIEIDFFALQKDFKTFSFVCFFYTGALTLHGNRFTGTFPKISRLNSLSNLDLGDNQLTGVVSSELGLLLNLAKLDLSSNRLSGILPPELCNLLSLEQLKLGLNRITGTIPSCLSNLAHLNLISLLSNNLNGTIPSELSSLRSLNTLDLSSNNFSSFIPPELGRLNELETLDLHSNNLTGSMPIDICRSNSIAQLTIDCGEIICTADCNCQGTDQPGEYFACPVSNTTFECIDGFVEMKIEIAPDDFPEETSWDVSINGDTMFQGGVNGANYLCIPVEGCTIFTIYDAGNDGICCSRGKGYYALYIDNEVVVSGGDFTTFDTIPIGDQCG